LSEKLKNKEEQEEGNNYSVKETQLLTQFIATFAAFATATHAVHLIDGWD
jgi:hypothetical protein